MYFVTVAAPNELLSNNRHASNGMLWLAETQTVVARQFPTTIWNTGRQELFGLHTGTSIPMLQTLQTARTDQARRCIKYSTRSTTLALRD